MPAVQLKRLEDILIRMTSAVVTRAGLTDLTDSSVVQHILAAVARELDDSNYQLTLLQDLFSIDTASGDDLDSRAKDIQPGTLTRNPAQRAIGFLVFSRSVNTGSTITIPIGSVAKTASGVAVRTIAQGVISNTSAPQISGHTTGQDSGPIPAVAVNVGATSNVDVNTVVSFVGKPAGVDSVTNVTSFSQGSDTETDDSFRTRLKSFVAALPRSTVNALESAALGVQDPTTGRQILYAHVLEDVVDRGNVSLYVDDGLGSAGTYTSVTLETELNPALGGEEFISLVNKPVSLENPFTLYKNSSPLVVGTDYFINPASGEIFFPTALMPSDNIQATYTYFTGLVAQVQKVIDGDPNDQVNFPGIRAAGVLVRVLPPVVREISVVASLNLARGVDSTTVQNNVKSLITNYINTLGISGDVVRNVLIELIMSVQGVVDCAVVTPATNVVILDHEIPRISSADIELS